MLLIMQNLSEFIRLSSFFKAPCDIYNSIMEPEYIVKIFLFILIKITPTLDNIFVNNIILDLFFIL